MEIVTDGFKTKSDSNTVQPIVRMIRRSLVLYPEPVQFYGILNDRDGYKSTKSTTS